MKEAVEPLCEDPHPGRRERRKPSVDAASIELAAGLFAALGDPPRLRLMSLLLQGPACVSDLAAEEQEGMSTISQRLKVPA
jgi:ArsR family transcriptional regulator, lead/cadmium/zinc/bismuth-responsive transcriptional repressor